MKVVLTLAVLFVSLFIQPNPALKVCEKTLRWRLSGKTFPNDFPGKVKLIAFLKASCRFCIKQSKGLDNLRAQLISENYTNLQFLIVNSYDSDSVGRSSVFRQQTKNIPVLQDIKRFDVWRMYNASTDDMLVFDECDQLVEHMTLPYTYLSTGNVKNSIIKAYKQTSCSCKK